MKITTFALIPALALSFGTGTLAADDEETPLAEAMDELSGSLKRLRRARDWDAKAETIRVGQDACIKSLQYIPAKIEAMPAGADKAKAVADYKRLMGLTLAALGELELAFLAEDEAKADELVDKLKDLKKEGHEKYEDDE